MARNQRDTTTPDERQQIAEIRSRFYEALRNGASTEEATRYANETAAVKPKPRIVEAKPTAAPPLPPKPFERPPASTPDDLMRINGIGSGTVRRLADIGVDSYAQIAAWSDSEVERHDKLLNLRGRMQREDWVGQAKTLLS